jgi:hypothetical protein
LFLRSCLRFTLRLVLLRVLLLVPALVCVIITPEESILVAPIVVDTNSSASGIKNKAMKNARMILFASL